MNDTENARAHQEALEATSRAGSSANRARLWAGMNRYLAAETAHEHRAAEKEKAAEEEKKADADEAPGSP